MNNQTQKLFGWLPARIVVPAVILGFCAVAYYLTTTFDRVPPILKRGMQPADFPQIVILLIAALAILLMLRGPNEAVEPLSGKTLGTMGLLIGFPLVSTIDLFLGLGIFALALSFFWGERRLWALVTVAVLAPLCVFFLFDQVFEIRFPRGLLTTIWYG